VTSSATTPGEADDFYDAAPLEPHLLYQGEILVDVPTFEMPRPANWQLLRTRSGKRVDEALKQGGLGGLVNVLDSNLSKEQWQSDNLGDHAMAILQKRPALVLNTTCDLQNKNFMQIAPIVPTTPDDQEFLERLKGGGIASAFWIKTRPSEIPPESYADFELIQAVHKSYVRRIRPDQHFRLSPNRVRMLQSAITRYFGRPNSFDSRSDVAPRTGTYLCVNCFYMDAQIGSVSLQEGARFSTCQCGGTAWILKGR
jgi:hypothetical protein